MFHRFATLLSLMAGCHLGPPPVTAPAGGLRPGVIVSTAAEPGLADDLRAGLGDALARRALLGAGTAVDLTVLDASTEVLAVAGDVRIHRVRLAVEARLLGPRPRTLVLRADRSYESSGADGLDAAQARAAVFSALAVELADDVAAWLQQAPPVPPPSDPRDP